MTKAAASPGLLAIEELFGADHAWVSPWVANLPEDYIREYSRLIAEWQPNAHRFDTELGRYQIQGHVFIRLSQAYDHFVPWVQEKISFADQRVLEVGGGTGSCTAALLLAGADVRVLEINRTATDYARIRCEMLATSRLPEFQDITPNWLKGLHAFDWDQLSRDYRPTMIVCYALVEHLTPAERLVFLHNAMRILPIGGHLVVFETPNRLMPLDWHSSKLLFAEILPDWLLRRYLTISPRTNTPGLARPSLSETQEDDESLYRWGRGVSFHEFQLAVGLENFEVILDGYDGRIKNTPIRREVEDYEEAVRRILSEQAIPRGFARPSLDLVLRKTREPITALR